MTFQDLLEKIGINPVTLIAKDSPEKSVANDVYRNWTVKDKQKVRGILDAMYAVFYSRVKEGRGHVITDEKTLEKVMTWVKSNIPRNVNLIDLFKSKEGIILKHPTQQTKIRPDLEKFGVGKRIKQRLSA